jgi:hypothetical protein
VARYAGTSLRSCRAGLEKWLTVTEHGSYRPLSTLLSVLKAILLFNLLLAAEFPVELDNNFVEPK